MSASKHLEKEDRATQSSEYPPSLKRHTARHSSAYESVKINFSGVFSILSVLDRPLLSASGALIQ